MTELHTKFIHDSAYPPQTYSQKQVPNRIPILIRPMQIQLPTRLYKCTLQCPIGYQPRPSPRFRTVRYNVPLCVSYCQVGSGSPGTEIAGAV